VRHATDLIDGTEFVNSIHQGKRSAREVCIHFLDHIKSGEDKIFAFAHFDKLKALEQADTIDTRPSKGRLAGLPIGIKDIFDTVDFPTEYYSPIYRGNRPSRNCSVVARLKGQGALLLGKTATTEFAFMHTGPTRNPHDLHRTPGSSSAGSAAGIAAGFFPVALGTQTGGSLIKPAAYCGSFAFKPTFGLVSLEGVKPLAPSLDTVGWFGRSVADLELVANALIGFEPKTPKPARQHLRMVVARTIFWEHAESAARESLTSAVDRLRSCGHEFASALPRFDFRQLAAAHKMINDCEGSRSLAFEYECHRSLLSPSTLEMIEHARNISYYDEAKARAYVSALTAQIDRFMADCDAIITLSTAYEAPLGLEQTGTSDFIKTWHTLGMPQANVPLLAGPNRMPLGLQLIGRRGGDRDLLDAVRIVSDALGEKRSAVLPQEG
jgi:Asp-tRNA(Asn)/Glu-tRNA(Gln) amidotransferase A subunit family amidase